MIARNTVGQISVTAALLIVSVCVSGADRMAVPAGEYRALFATLEQAPTALRAFWLDRVPVTNAQFADFVASSPRWQRGKASALFTDDRYLQSWQQQADGRFAPRSDEWHAPVTHVSWFAAKAYCQAKGGRLPTTAEWEYVAGTGSVDPQQDEQRVLAWYSATTPATTPPVGQHEPNRYGVQDMHGLIWEWTQDFSSAMTTGESRGDSALDNQFFCGSAAAGSADPSQYAAFMRYALRSSLQGRYTVANLGFRCAYDREETP